MRWLNLDFEDEALFGTVMTNDSCNFFRKHKETFKQMWHDQGKTFWLRFLVVYRSSFLNHGRALQYLSDPLFPFCQKRYLHCVDSAFINLHKTLIEENYGSVKRLIVNIIILTNCSFLVSNVGSNSLATDPFYVKSTRETFRDLFGKPSDGKILHFKVTFMCPVYVHFGGALFCVLQRWLSEKNLSDDEIKDIDKNKPYWKFPVEWTKSDFTYSTFEEYLSSYWNGKLSALLNRPDKIIKKIFIDGKNIAFCNCYQSSSEFNASNNKKCICFGSVNPCPKICPLCYVDILKPRDSPVLNKSNIRNKSSPANAPFMSNMPNKDTSCNPNLKEKVNIKTDLKKNSKKKISRNEKHSANKKNQSEELSKFDDPFYRLKLLKMAEKKFKKENEDLVQENVSNTVDPIFQTLNSKKKKKTNKKFNANHSKHFSSASSNSSSEKNSAKSVLLENAQAIFTESDEESDFSLWELSDDSSDYFPDIMYDELFLEDNSNVGQNKIYDGGISRQNSHINPQSNHDNFDLKSVKEKLDIIEKGIEETGGIGYEEFMLMLQAGKELVGDSKKGKDSYEEKGIVADKKQKNIEKQRQTKLNTCANCLIKETIPKTFKKCSRCKTDNLKPCYYCSRDCQVEDWEERHRDEHLQAC